jgi:hypothetical protein
MMLRNPLMRKRRVCLARAGEEAEVPSLNLDSESTLQLALSRPAHYIPWLLRLSIELLRWKASPSVFGFFSLLLSLLFL